MTNAELIKALRCCESCNVCDFAKHDKDLDSHECVFGAKGQGDMNMLAADVIEYQQRELERADRGWKKQFEIICELQSQLPDAPEVDGCGSD